MNNKLRFKSVKFIYNTRFKKVLGLIAMSDSDSRVLS